MPKCPGKDCDIDWQWGWCSDIFRGQNREGKPCDLVYKKKDGKTWQVFTCNECGTELLRQEDGGGEEINPKEWEGIDWEQPENGYDRDFE